MIAWCIVRIILVLHIEIICVKFIHVLLLVNIYILVIRNNSSYKSNKVMPGWNEVQQLKEEALSWHAYWKTHGLPTSIYVAEIHRVIRARYHRAIGHIGKKLQKSSLKKWLKRYFLMDLGVCGRKLKKLKGKKGKWHAVWMVAIFRQIYIIYNSVPYDTSEMKSIESSVLSRIFNSPVMIILSL